MTSVADAAYHTVHDYPGGSPSLAPRLDMSFLGDDTELVWRHYGLTLHEIREANWLLLNDPKAGTTCYRALAAEIRAQEATPAA